MHMHMHQPPTAWCLIFLQRQLVAEVGKDDVPVCPQHPPATLSAPSPHRLLARSTALGEPLRKHAAEVGQLVPRPVVGGVYLRTGPDEPLQLLRKRILSLILHRPLHPRVGASLGTRSWLPCRDEQC